MMPDLKWQCHLVSFLGVTSTGFGLIALCFKYDSTDKMSKTGHKIYGAHYLTVWIGVVYVGVSVGAIYVGQRVPWLRVTPRRSPIYRQDEAETRLAT